ncbi:hypothetical protein QAD02_002282 [Eretmocerus hayati]|uniref:Uncharacterized protein n=1 Tax=Eretmocerus hayati TaxID=131215 RepID=A0ACC2NJE1_9HYME|nr:hypothetical protein QAD02_002282 [Eretmocerus hayati]
MVNSDGNGVSGSGGPIKLSYDVPSRQCENEQHQCQSKNDQKTQRQGDCIEPQLKLRSDKSNISVRDNDTMKGEPTIVHQTPEFAAGYSQQAKTSPVSASSQEQRASDYDERINESLSVNNGNMHIDHSSYPGKCI